ncbi:MAG: hypothetical protein JSR84_18900 [Proteobacteria bacterium]|nr:hypothetical protein [Pseudomonadota bacterium]
MIPGSKFRLAALTASVLLLISACGGDDSPSSNADPQGAYAGTLSGGNGNKFELLMLEDGSYWALYGDESAGTFFVSGFIEGSGAVSGATFTSSNARDFGTDPSTPGSVSASVKQGESISGTARFGSQTVSFSGTTAAVAPYDYNQPAQLTDIAGRWTLSMLTGETAGVTISDKGAIAGFSSGGCAFTGSIAPRPSGKNVFNLSVTFGSVPCALPGQKADGVALSSLTAAGKRQLIVATVDASRQYGTAGFGTR